MSIEHIHIPVYLLLDTFTNFLNQFLSQGNPFTAGFHSTPLSQIGPFKMMSRGTRSASITHTKSSNKRSKSSIQASAPGPSTAKRSRSRGPVQAINQSGCQHPSELVCQPVVPPQGTPDSAAMDSATPLSAALSNLVPSLTNAISSAVVASLKSIGILPLEDSSTSDTAAAVHGSVAAVVHDFTGEGHNSSSITPESDEIVSGPCDSGNRPDKVHQLISVPLASRVPEKIWAKIWANEYIDLGTLLTSFPSDPKYNFTVKSSAASNQPIVNLEPVQTTKRIATIEQWISSICCYLCDTLF